MAPPRIVWCLVFLTSFLSGCAGGPATTASAGARGTPRTEAAASESAQQAPDSEALRACCEALRTSADALPPPKSFHAGAAAERCRRGLADVHTTEDEAHLVATIRGELRGAPMPTACE